MTRPQGGLIIIARYGEIHLKGRNRAVFLNALTRNLRNAVGEDCKIELHDGRYVFTEYPQNKEDELVTRISRIFGLTSVSPCKVIKHDQILIFMAGYARMQQSQIIEGINGEKSWSFRVSVNRADKTFPYTSMDFAKMCGAVVIENSCAVVDLHNPQITINVDIRADNTAYFYNRTTPAVGGLPVGVSGRALVLLSGGIDSPVSAFLAAKRGLTVDYIHFASPPYTSDLALYKVRRLTEALEPSCGKGKLHIINTTKILQEIKSKCDAQYTITLLRRMMVRIAKSISARDKYDCLITGENLAQVASQTIQGITTNNVLAGELPILRPLITYDKAEIIALAKQIGTYEISIEPHEDCCTVFVPSSPVITPTIAKCEREEQKLDIDKLLQNTW